MARTPMNAIPMTTKQRRDKSNAARAATGEEHLVVWLSKDAAKALRKLMGRSPPRGAKKSAVEQALINEAAREK